MSYLGAPFPSPCTTQVRAGSRMTPEEAQAKALELWENADPRPRQVEIARTYGTSEPAVSAALKAARLGQDATRYAAVYGYIIEHFTPYALVREETVEFRIVRHGRTR